LARTMEPRVPRPEKRFAAIRGLAEAGVPTGAMHGPMIPGLSDHELESLMERSRSEGAIYAAYTLLRLPLEVAPLFEEWLETFTPNRAGRVISLMKAINGGKIYDVTWSRGDGPRHEISQLLARRFQKAYRKYGFIEAPKMRNDLFRVPVAKDGQQDLFGRS
ncbi:MAG: radical SAM protein, partial [Pseudomonadota bacterium]